MILRPPVDAWNTYFNADFFPLENQHLNFQRNQKISPRLSEDKIFGTSKAQKAIPQKLGSTGSGFFISKLSHIVTNAHVVKNCDSITVGDTAKKQVATTLLETDKRNDLALLKISST